MLKQEPNIILTSKYSCKVDRYSPFSLANLYCSCNLPSIICSSSIRDWPIIESFILSIIVFAKLLLICSSKLFDSCSHSVQRVYSAKGEYSSGSYVFFLWITMINLMGKQKSFVIYFHAYLVGIGCQYFIQILHPTRHYFLNL